MAEQLRSVTQKEIVTKETPVMDMRVALEADGVKVSEPSEIVPMPASIQYDGFEDLDPNYMKFIPALAARCQEYLNGIFIKDGFGANHDARVAWRKKMNEQYGEEFDLLDRRNKYRHGKMTPLYVCLTSLSDSLDAANVHTPQADVVRRLDKSFPDVSAAAGYGDMSYEEKEKAIAQIDTIARTFLDLVTKKDRVLH